MDLQNISDRLELRDLCDSFNAAAMRKDIATWTGYWADDCKWFLPVFDQPISGIDRIVPAFEERLSHVESISLVGFPLKLTIDGDRAHGQFYCQEIIFPKDGSVRKFILACYHDEYVREAGRWKFSSRRYEVFGRA